MLVRRPAQQELELLRRRLFLAKAERLDTTQLELEFGHKLAALDALSLQLGEPDPQKAPSSGAGPALPRDPTNLRRSFEGLSNEVREVLRHDPLGGHVFVFLNRRRNQVKLLVYTRGGFTIVHKRLEKGAFASLWRDDGQVVRLTASELALFIEGCTLVGKD